MHCDILTPDKALFSGECNGIKLPGASGKFEILENHAPIISRLDAGEIEVRTPSGNEVFQVKGGVVEVQANKVVVLV